MPGVRDGCIWPWAVCYGAGMGGSIKATPSPWSKASRTGFLGHRISFEILGLSRGLRGQNKNLLLPGILHKSTSRKRPFGRPWGEMGLVSP